MFEEGLSYPLKGDNALGRIVIGGVLSYASVLVLPIFLIFGYLMWVLEASARGEESPPAFEDWGEMFVDGLKGFAVAFVYSVVPVGIVAVSVVFAGAGASSGNDAAAGILGGVGLLGVLVSLLAMVVLYYLVPAALTNMALEGSFGAAFDAGTLKRVLLSADYLVAWLIPFVVVLVLNVVSVLLVALTFGIGGLLLPFVQFYVQVSVFFMFGRAFDSAVGVSTTGSPTETPEYGV